MEPLAEDIRDTFVKMIDERGNADIARQIIAGRFIFLSKEVREGVEIRLVSSQVAERLSSWSDPEEPASVGEFWGLWTGDEWRPSLEAAVRIGGNGNRGRVIINDHATQLFLYGRDILGGSILHADRSMRPGDVAWVCSPDRQVIGLATIVERWDSPDVVLKPIIDLGWYLREGG